MPLSTKAKKELIIAMGSKKDADALEASMDANTALTRDQLKRVEIMLCDKKRAAEMAAKIASPAQISEELKRDLEIALADDDQVADASDGESSMESNIES